MGKAYLKYSIINEVNRWDENHEIIYVFPLWKVYVNFSIASSVDTHIYVNIYCNLERAYRWSALGWVLLKCLFAFSIL